mmetsp:Transcript_7020/g.26274  ORF Transcript_7020/g.26274 Transcript_7020/m.26274 type:complete len:125 (-) Transcript_7020:352-726(-)
MARAVLLCILRHHHHVTGFKRGNEHQRVTAQQMCFSEPSQNVQANKCLCEKLEFIRLQFPFLHITIAFGKLRESIQKKRDWHPSLPLSFLFARLQLYGEFSSSFRGATKHERDKKNTGTCLLNP